MMAGRGLLLSLMLLWVTCSVSWSQDTNPVVDTVYGSVQGFSALDTYNRTYDAFLGIPFAKPPVGSLRWQPSEPPEPWDDILNATKYTDHCIQPISGAYGLIGLRRNDSEDCLYLNVFVPKSVDDALANPLPVMVFYYGGGLLIGTTQMYPCQELATGGDLVVVSVNYRVSTMGFFSTGDSAAPGNYGFWDVKTSLDWVHDNIANFGGDSSSITIIGQSAGAQLVVHTMLSPVTNQLFNRGIAMSGGAWYPSNPGRMSNMLADINNCSTTSSQEIVDCLMEVDGKELDSDAYLGSILQGGFVDFGPVVDGVFVTEDPRESWKAGVAKDMDFMTGYTFHDSGGIVLRSVFGMPFNRTNGGNRENTELYESMLNKYEGYNNTEEIMQTLYNRYPEMNSSDAVTASQAVTRVETDLTFAAPTFYGVEKHVQSQGNGTAYFYEFHHRQSFLTGYAEWMNGSHLDDIYSVLGEPFLRGLRNLYFVDENFGEEDEELSNIIISYYSNFAYTRNPNLGPHTVPVEWPEYDLSGRQYLLQTPTPIILSQDQAMIDNYNWILYDFQEMLGRPEWGLPQDLQSMFMDVLSFFLLDDLY